MIEFASFCKMPKHACASVISGPILLDIMFVCTLQDLRDLFERMEQFWWAVFYLNGYLREPENSYRQAEFAKLDSFPNIKFPF